MIGRPVENRNCVGCGYMTNGHRSGGPGYAVSMRMNIPQKLGPINRTVDEPNDRYTGRSGCGPTVPVVRGEPSPFRRPAVQSTPHTAQDRYDELRSERPGTGPGTGLSGPSGAAFIKPDHLRSKTQSAFVPAAAT